MEVILIYVRRKEKGIYNISKVQGTEWIVLMTDNFFFVKQHYEKYFGIVYAS